MLCPCCLDRAALKQQARRLPLPTNPVEWLQSKRSIDNNDHIEIDTWIRSPLILIRKRRFLRNGFNDRCRLVIGCITNFAFDEEIWYFYEEEIVDSLAERSEYEIANE